MNRGQVNLAEEDKIIIESIKRQDRYVFELLYKKYYKQLFAVAYRYVRHVEMAEEIVHDVFITVWNKAAQLNIQYAIKNYLFKAVVNSSLNAIKKEKMLTEKRLAYLSVLDKNSDVLNEESGEANEILLKILEEALELLPAKCKEVMFLSRFGKLKQYEIAKQMNISLKTVKNHLTYGFQKLRQHLASRQATLVLLILLLKNNML